MAFMINEECINCGACESECSTQAISPDKDKFHIDPSTCTECIGSYSEPQCASVCPVDACVKDSMHKETDDELMEKYNSLKNSSN